MLKAEKVQEIGFLSNSHISIDLEQLQKEIEEELEVKVRLRYKAIFQGRKKRR